jgi:hypothetical protein
LDVPDVDAEFDTPELDAESEFHIGIMTGTVSQEEDGAHAAEQMIKLYGDVSEGGMICYVTYPDDFMSEMETTATLLEAMADDPLMKVVVASQAIPGTAEGFRRIKEKRPDIICLAGEAHEHPNMIASFADMVANADFVSRGYLIPHSARELGAKTFVHKTIIRR